MSSAKGTKPRPRSNTFRRRRSRATLLLEVLLHAVLVLGLMSPCRVRAQQRSTLLRWYTSGPAPDSLSERRNPARLIRHIEVQRLLVDIRSSPRDADFVTAALDGTGVSLDDLLATRLVHEEDGSYQLGFPLITKDDAQKLAQVSERFGRGLADAYVARWSEFEEILERYPLPEIKRSELAFLLVGCFSLDWDGLDLTSELGYRSVRREPPPIVTWVIEPEAARPKAVYWGSHNEYLSDGVVFTSFGDFHSVPRAAFPDIMWAMERGMLDEAVPDELQPTVQAVAGQDLDELMRQLGAVMITLREGDKTLEGVTQAAGLDASTARDLLGLLEGVQYVRQKSGRYTTAIAVFTEADREMVTDVTRLSREVMTAWLEGNYEPYKAELMRVTTIGHALPFAASFWNVWHWLFGTVNRILVEDGLFEDPYGAERRYKGFVPVVWHRYATVAP